MFLCVLLTGCCTRTTVVRVKNDSMYNYIGFYSYTDSFGNAFDNISQQNLSDYDTCKQKSLDWLYFFHNYCPKGDTLLLKFQASGYHEIFEHTIDGKLRFFFISDSIYLSTPWDTIVKYQMYDRKLTFEKKGLKSLNWTITLK